jgi:hypothetical protein
MSGLRHILLLRLVPLLTILTLALLWHQTQVGFCCSYFHLYYNFSARGYGCFSICIQ